MATILVLDDERVVRELMSEILRRAGHDVVPAASVEEALAQIAGGGFALVVSDMIMPGLGGLDLLRRLREAEPSLPVVLVTGAGTDENLDAALAGGAAAVVQKPFSHAQLADAVAAALAAG